MDKLNFESESNNKLRFISSILLFLTISVIFAIFLYFIWIPVIARFNKKENIYSNNI